jgi:ATP-dependent Lhr-like helicase
MQFAQPGVLDLLRSLRDAPEEPEIVTLAATDPANPYGALLEWPPVAGAPEGKRPARAVGASVVLVDGELAAHVSKGARQLFAWLPEFEPERSRAGEAIARAVADLALATAGRDGAALVGEIDGAPADAHPLAPYLAAVGFHATAAGLQLTRRAAAALAALPAETDLG